MNLAIRFLLELTALASVGMWGWRQTDGWQRWVLAIGIPILLAAIWGTFAVPDDPSRSGAAPVVTSGAVRLLIELGFFAFASWAVFTMGYSKPGLVFLAVVVLHYVASYDRVMWLLSK